MREEHDARFVTFEPSGREAYLSPYDGELRSFDVRQSEDECRRFDESRSGHAGEDGNREKPERRILIGNGAQGGTRTPTGFPTGT